MAIGRDFKILRTAEPPCRGCNDRTEACHASCGRYAEWQAAHIEALRKYKNRRLADAMAYNPRAHKRLLQKKRGD